MKIEIKKIIYYLSNSLPIKRISIFLLGGGINLILKIALTTFLTEIMKIHYFTSYIITLATVIIYSFFYNAYLTFEVRDRKRSNFVKYILALLMFNFADAFLVRLITDLIGVYYIVSIIFVTGSLLICKYVIYNKVVFRG